MSATVTRPAARMSEAAQLQLGLRERKRRFDQSHVAILIEKLKAGATDANRGWLTAADLGARTWSEKRDVRAIAAREILVTLRQIERVAHATIAGNQTA